MIGLLLLALVVVVAGGSSSAPSTKLPPPPPDVEPVEVKPRPIYKFTSSAGTVSWFWDRGVLDDTIFESEAWDTASARAKVDALLDGQSVKIAGETLTRHDISTTDEAIALGPKRAPNDPTPVVLLLTSAADNFTWSYLLAAESEHAGVGIRYVVVRVVDGEGAAWALQRDIVRVVLEEMAEGLDRSLVIAATPGFPSTLALELASKPDPWIVAAVVVEPEPDDVEPLLPTVVFGELVAEQAAALDALSEAGRPLALVADESPHSWALMVLATVELRR